MTREWVSDKIGESYKEWKNGDIITITAGTGVGKSHFIKNDLYKWAKSQDKRILFLIHRVNCVEQFKSEIERDNKTDVITIRTYQAIEHKYLQTIEDYNFDKYDYIVLDEFHYFMSDAQFNITTDISFDQIINSGKILICMSATANNMTKYINNYKKKETIPYNMPIEFNFIKSLTFVNSDDSTEQLLEDLIKENKKSIFFINSAEKAYNLHKKFKEHTMFNCSKSNKDYYKKYVDKDKVKTMLENERFEDLILITTSTMDAGVNIKDLDLKTIYVDIPDTEVLKQCIGRKRIQGDGDSFDLYIKNINGKSLEAKRRRLEKKREMAEYFSEHGEHEYLKKYHKSYDSTIMVYDKIGGGKKLNELMYFKSLIDIVEIDDIKMFGEFGYCKHMALMFECVDRNCSPIRFEYKVYECEKKKLTLSDKLDKLVGKKLWKDEQKELIDMIDMWVNRRQKTRIDALNIGLELEKIPYQISSTKDKTKRLPDGTENPNKDKHYWTVIRVEN